MKRAIPAAQVGGLQGKFNASVKEVLEVIIGQRGEPIATIDTSALSGTDRVLAEKINEIIARLQ